MGRFLLGESGYLFDSKVIKAYYNLKEGDYECFQSLAQSPNYDMIIECLRNGQV